MEINGIAHIQLTVNDMARSMPFYEQVLTAFGLRVVMRSEQFFYCVGGRTGVAITPADSDQRGEKFLQRRVGLHHVCFRARAREDVDAAHAVAQSAGAAIVHPPQRDDIYAPGYYSVLFEDPDGIRIEVNHVPGRGLLEPGAKSPVVDVVPGTKAE
ncbi:MAG: VOC family protein [Myxococcales bacterium]|nr:VOC family protein [Myxococcales bacterium]